MGWTLAEYNEQPAHFVDTVYSMLIEEAAHREQEIKRATKS